MLEGKIILVTGAAQGIGRQTAVDLAKHGAKLALADIIPCDETSALLEELNTEYFQATVDITKFDQCAHIVALAQDRFGRIDGLVHLAAAYANLTLGPFEEIPSDEFTMCMDVNIAGTWNVCRAVSPVMKEAGRGSIVNVVSNTAIAGWPGLAHYAASKGACITMTRVIARELGSYNIRVNSVAPTSVNTESTRTLVGDNFSEVEDQVLSSQIIGRYAEAKDITGVFAYLLSDHSQIVTGQCWAVDCGMTVN